MPEPKKVSETEDESSFEAEEEPIIIPKAYTKPLQEPPEEPVEDEDGEYDEVIPDFDGPGGMTASVSVTTWTDGEKTVNLTIDNCTIAIPIEDFLVLVAELKGALPELRDMAKE